MSLRSSSSVKVAYREIAVDLMVIHRSCSSCRVSVKRASPAFAAEIIPARWTSESVRVDFPWSTIRGIPSASSYMAIVLRFWKILTVGNDRHVTDVGGLIHKGPDLANLLAVLSRHTDKSRSGARCVCTSSTVKLLRTNVLANAFLIQFLTAPLHYSRASPPLRQKDYPRGPCRCSILGS